MYKINKNKIINLNGITIDENNNIIVNESLNDEFIQITFLLQEYFLSYENYDGEDICNNYFTISILYELIIKDKNIYVENFSLDFYESLLANVTLFLHNFCESNTINMQ